jgi:hypothetical protein
MGATDGTSAREARRKARELEEGRKVRARSRAERVDASRERRAADARGRFRRAPPAIPRDIRFVAPRRDATRATAVD